MNLSNPFIVEQNKIFEGGNADVYAFRKVGMMGRDYIFIHDLSKTGNNSKSAIEAVHEAERKYVNSLYKMPKILRLKVPNIISFFISSNGFTNDVLQYANIPGRSATGGEFHFVFLIDCNEKTIYGQGKSIISVDGMNFEFKSIDPQNRAFQIASSIRKILFE